MIQKLLDRDRVAPWIERAREAEERINLCRRRELLGVVECLNRRFKEHLTAAREQKAVGWLRSAIARFGPCVGARKLHHSVLPDRQLGGANSIGLHERLHRMV